MKSTLSGATINEAPSSATQDNLGFQENKDFSTQCGMSELLSAAETLCVCFIEDQQDQTIRNNPYSTEGQLIRMLMIELSITRMKAKRFIHALVMRGSLKLFARTKLPIRTTNEEPCIDFFHIENDPDVERSAYG